MSGPAILCPVDFSDHSRRALQYAARMAQHFVARLTILTVVDPMLTGAAAIEELDLIKETETELGAFARASVPDLEARVGGMRILVLAGDAATEILKFAHQEHADVIVMGTHGLSGYRKLFFGSITERVLRQGEVPVLAVPLGTEDVLVPAERLPSLLDPIVAPIDFSESSTYAARVGAGLAESVGVRLALVHAVPPISAIARWREQAAAQDAANLTEARQRLEELARSLSMASPPAMEVRVGTPAEVIAAFAAEQKARLIVIGLRGAGGLLGPAPGSVTYRVLSLASVPVLALPHKASSTATAPRKVAEDTRRA